MITAKTKWTHRRDGYDVVVAETGDLLTKEAHDANWQRAVAYYREDEGDNDGRGPLRVRAEADFLAKFKESH